MTYAQVSPKFQIVIPREVRQRLALRPKQRLVVLEKEGIIHLIPEVPLAKMKGFFKGQGLDSRSLREKKDRL